VGIRPEQRTGPADDNRVRITAPPSGIEEATLERRARQIARVGVTRGRPVGKGLVAQYPAGNRLFAAGRLELLSGLGLRRRVLWRRISFRPRGRSGSWAALARLARRVTTRLRLDNLLLLACVAIAAGGLRLLLPRGCGRRLCVPLSARGRWRRTRRRCLRRCV